MDSPYAVNSAAADAITYVQICGEIGRVRHAATAAATALTTTIHAAACFAVRKSSPNPTSQLSTAATAAMISVHSIRRGPVRRGPPATFIAPPLGTGRLLGGHLVPDRGHELRYLRRDRRPRDTRTEQSGNHEPHRGAGIRIFPPAGG